MISTSSSFLLFSCTKSFAGQVELVVIYGYTSARLHAFGHKFETQIRAIRTNKSLKVGVPVAPLLVKLVRKQALE